MKPLNSEELKQYWVMNEFVRVQTGTHNTKWNAAMVFPFDDVELRVIASSGGGWDHVSVSTEERVPTWYEMDYIKRKLFFDDEVVMQLHVAVKDHINNNPFVLHLWRPRGRKIPLPPKEFV